MEVLFAVAQIAVQLITAFATTVVAVCVVIFLAKKRG